MVFVYRALVFCVSGAVHFTALFGVCWFAFTNIEVLVALEYNALELGVIAACMQVLGFIVVISPLGSFVQTSSSPVRALSHREANLLLPLLDEVMDAYHDKKTKRIKKIELFMIDNPESNAAAFGKNKIALTTGILNEYKWRNDVLKAVIAHELGHLHHHDLRFWDYVDAHGGMLHFIVILLRFSDRSASAISSVFLPFLMISIPLQILYIFVGYGLYIMSLPVAALVKLEVYFSRSIEYRADKFSADIVGLDGLLSFLEYLKGDERYMVFGLFNMQFRSHPPSELRIDKLHKHPEYKSSCEVVVDIPKVKKTYQRKKSCVSSVQVQDNYISL